MRSIIIFITVVLLCFSSDVLSSSDLFKEAKALYNEARFTEAIDVYRRIIDSEPESIKALLNLVYIYKDLTKYDQAIRIIKEKPQLFQDLKARKLLARLYYLKGEPQEAIFLLNQLLSYNLDDPELLFYLAICYEDIGNFARAEKFYLDAIRANSYEVLAYLKLGDFYFKEARFKEAVQNYQKIIDLDPSIVQARQGLAESLASLGKYEDAYTQYAKCVAIRPQDKLFKAKLEKIKSKLSKDFFKKKEASILKRRKIKSMRVEPSVYARVAPLVRVGIAKISGSIEFKSGEPFEIIDKQNGNSLFEGQRESVYSLGFNKKEGIQLRDQRDSVMIAGLNAPFFIKNKSENSVITIFDLCFGEGSFWAGWHDYSYRGIIEVIPKNDGFQLINLINLEEYLYSVLPSEMPVSWPKEALCAQAVAARTWAVRNKGYHKSEGFDFCSSVHCQVYKGASAETSFTNQAVDETAEIILISDNHPTDIFYSNNCGGCTRDGVVDAPSADFYFPLSPLELEDWLMDEPRTFCNLKEERKANFRWVRLYKREQLDEMLNKAGMDIGELVRIIPMKREISGHLRSIKFEGKKNSDIVEGEHNIRKMLGDLRSSAFKIETKLNQQDSTIEFIFHGAGFGHARGLCQTGMKGMALKGHNYLEILKHYYPDAETERLY